MVGIVSTEQTLVTLSGTIGARAVGEEKTGFYNPIINLNFYELFRLIIRACLRKVRLALHVMCINAITSIKSREGDVSLSGELHGG